MKDKLYVKTEKARLLKVLATIVIVAAFMIMTAVVTSGCGFIKPINDQTVPAGNSSVEDGGTTSGKQFGIPSNGGYYSAH